VNAGFRWVYHQISPKAPSLYPAHEHTDGAGDYGRASRRDGNVRYGGLPDSNTRPLVGASSFKTLANKQSDWGLARPSRIEQSIPLLFSDCSARAVNDLALCISHNEVREP
jgi:hypothetical protein